MKSLFNFIFIFVMLSTIYGGIANNSIYTFILILKYSFLLALLLFSLQIFNKKYNLRIFTVLILTLLYYSLTNKTFSILMFLYIIQLYSIFLIAFWLYKYNDYLHIIKKLYIASYLFLLVGFVFLFYDNSLLINHSTTGIIRYAGFYGNAIWWGFTNATLTIFSVYLYTLTKKPYYLFATIITFIFCITSGTRGALLLVILFVFFYFLYHKKILLTIVATVVILIILLNSTLLIELLIREGSDDILTGRSFIWLSAYESLSIDYFNGYGFKETGSILLTNGYKGPGYHEDSLSLSLHNSYLEILFGNGIVFLGMVIIIFRYLVSKAKKTNKFIYSYILAYMIVSIFESFLVYPYFFSTYIFYLLIFYLLINNFYQELKSITKEH